MKKLSKIRIKATSQKLLLGLLILFTCQLVSAADVYWANPVDGNWNVGANWSTGTVPGINDNAFIDLDGTYSLTINSNITVNSLTMGGLLARNHWPLRVVHSF